MKTLTMTNRKKKETTTEKRNKQTEMENRNTVKLKNSTKSTKLHITAYTPTHTHYSRRSEKCVTGKTKKKTRRKSATEQIASVGTQKTFSIVLATCQHNLRRCCG